MGLLCYVYFAIASCFVLNPFVTNLLISVSISVSSFVKSSINTLKLNQPSWYCLSQVLYTETTYNIGELGYDGPLFNGFLHMTDDMLGPSPINIKY